MKKKPIRILFWVHLSLGVVAGSIIAIQCLTGAAMAFQTDLESWLDRGQIRVTVPADGRRMSTDELRAYAQTQHPDRRFQRIEPQAAADAAWRIGAGDHDTYYLNPYTGKTVVPASMGLHEGFDFILHVHRWLAFSGDARDAARVLTGSANVCFFLLCLLGAWLWRPAGLSACAIKTAVRPNFKLEGQARNYSLHRSFGFWALLPLLLITATGTTFYFDWGKSAADGMLGPRPSRGLSESEQSAAATTSDRRTTLESRLTMVASAFPAWESCVLNLPLAETPSTKEATPGKKRRPPPPEGLILVRESGNPYPHVQSRLVINPESGAIVVAESAADLAIRTKLRASVKDLHTGEIAGLPGRVVAFFAAVVGLLLCYTGYALSLARLRTYRQARKTSV